MLAALIVLWFLVLLVAVFFAGRSSNQAPTDRTTRRDPADVVDALDLLVDEGVISVEHREQFWRLYVMRARA